MKSGLAISNVPLFSDPGRRGGFQEVWYMRLNQPGEKRALWLRFTILIRHDGSKAVAEVWAIFFDACSGPTRKVGLKSTLPLSAFLAQGASGFRIGDASLSETHTEGTLRNDQDSISWSLDMSPETDDQHDFIPAVLLRAGLVKNIAWTPYESLLFNGWCEVNGERYKWTGAPGMQGHLAGPKNGHSWVWGHCNRFLDADGAPAPVIWDGISARARVGRWAAPSMGSMFLKTGERCLCMNTLRDGLRIRSSYDYDGWRFSAVKEGYVIEGHLQARRNDYAGVTYEDTDGSFLYCHNAKICDMTLEVTAPRGRPQRYSAEGAVAYEVVSRTPHPDIPFVI